MDSAEISLRRYLDKLLDELNYNSRDVQVQPVSSGGANFTSALYKVAVSSPDKQTLHLFCKVANVGNTLREIMRLDDSLYHEYFVYQELQKSYDALQDKYCIPDEDKFRFCKYYGSTLEKGCEVFVFEDLNLRGYHIYDRFETLKWDHASEIIKALAKFHALSFVLEKENIEVFEQIVKFQFPINNLADLLRENVEVFFEGLSDCHKDKLRNFTNRVNCVTAVRTFYQPYGKNIILHSDFRPSNIMYKKVDGKVSVLPLDYQTVRVGSVASDITYFMMTATDGAFRRKHFDQLMDLYYTELELRLEAMNINVDTVYPREQFDKELRKMLPLSLVLALAMYPLLVVPADEAPQASGTDDDISNFILRPNRKSSERLAELVDDLIRWNLL